MSVSEAVNHDNRRIRLDRSNTLEIKFANPTQIFKYHGILTEPTEQLVGALCGLVRAGHHAHVSAQALGINRRTFENWCGKGFADELGETVYGRMVLAIESAEALGEIEDIERINAGGEIGNIQWKRERRSAKRWGNKTAVAIAAAEIADAPKVAVEHGYTIDEGAQILTILEELGYAPGQLNLPAPEAIPAAQAVIVDPNPIPVREAIPEASMVEKFFTGKVAKR